MNTEAENLKKSLLEERKKATKQFDAERARAVRAEKHLRECISMLEKFADCIPDTYANEVRELIKPRIPVSCNKKMSWYQTCRLGTYGCISKHLNEEGAPDLGGRLTIPITRSK
jgi:hypothetical protein